jgi:hypothetical protein
MNNEACRIAARMPINRRIGFLDKVLADAVVWYLRHPLNRTWHGGELGELHMLDETDHNHARVDEAARLFQSELAEAIHHLIERLEVIRGEVTSDPRFPR